MSKFPHPHVTVEWLIKRAEGFLPGIVGVQPIEVAEKRLVTRLDIEQRHTAPNGYLHAATVIALADTTCGYATLAHLPDGAKNFTTIEMKSNHLGTATEGGIVAEARARHLGKNTHVWDAEVSRETDGKVIALFRNTQMILR